MKAPTPSMIRSPGCRRFQWRYWGYITGSGRFWCRALVRFRMANTWWGCGLFWRRYWGQVPKVPVQSLGEVPEDSGADTVKRCRRSVKLLGIAPEFILLALFWGVFFWCKPWDARFFCYGCLFYFRQLFVTGKCAKRAWSVDCKQVVVKFMWINCGRSLRQSAQEFEKEKRLMKEQPKRGAWCEIHSTPKPQASVGTVKRCETEWYKQYMNKPVLGLSNHVRQNDIKNIFKKMTCFPTSFCMFETK